MKKVLILTIVALSLGSSLGCRCCDWLFRRGDPWSRSNMQCPPQCAPACDPCGGPAIMPGAEIMPTPVGG